MLIVPTYQTGEYSFRCRANRRLSAAHQRGPPQTAAGRHPHRVIPWRRRYARFPEACCLAVALQHRELSAQWPRRSPALEV